MILVPHRLILLLLLVFPLNPRVALAGEFLFLCEISWTKSSGEIKSRCMKEQFGKQQRIDEAALRGIHKAQQKGIKKRFPNGKCSTSSHKTRMSLDVRTVCQSPRRIIEFASIWPLDIRTKQYFRSSMPSLIEAKLIEFFRNTHLSPKQEKDPILDWRR